MLAALFHLGLVVGEYGAEHLALDERVHVFVLLLEILLELLQLLVVGLEVVVHNAVCHSHHARHSEGVEEPCVGFQQFGVAVVNGLERVDDTAEQASALRCACPAVDHCFELLLMVDDAQLVDALVHSDVVFPEVGKRCILRVVFQSGCRRAVHVALHYRKGVRAYRDVACVAVELHVVYAV